MSESYPFTSNYARSASRGQSEAVMGSSTSFKVPQSATVHDLPAYRHNQKRSSQTWTTSSGGVGTTSDTDKLDDRTFFVQEYNRLAKKHGVRVLVVKDFVQNQPKVTGKRGWLHRIIKSSSERRYAHPKPIPSSLAPRHRRSVSDIAHNLARARRELPKTIDLQAMVRLSGRSILYLPHDYAPGSLILPTSIRATAQYLAQHATTRGIFRIPGSIKAVNALFDYYCVVENGGVDVANTVHCANIPKHLNLSIHEVASTFKRLLSILPGGILGGLSVFDALVAIQSTLRGDPEFPRTKQTKARARLIALALSTIESQFQRELICAVFGLLSLVGRAAEVAPREDEGGRPLPTSDLMGYGALGIIFGPLLIGTLLEQYTMKLADPTSGLLLFPLSPSRSRQNRRRSRPSEYQGVDKIMVANSITEMLISNWRDIVRQMKNLGTHHRKDVTSVIARPNIRASASDIFASRNFNDMNTAARSDSSNHVNRSGSPEHLSTPTTFQRQRLHVKKNVRPEKSLSRPCIGPLSPTYEESPHNLSTDSGIQTSWHQNTVPSAASPTRSNPDADSSISGFAFEADGDSGSEQHETMEKLPDQTYLICRQPKKRILSNSPEISANEIPPRTSSKYRDYKQKVYERGKNLIVTTSSDNWYLSRTPEVKATGREVQTGECETNGSFYNMNNERYVPISTQKAVSNESINKTPDEFYARETASPGLTQAKPPVVGQEA